jgi:hypothetical protein
MVAGTPEHQDRSEFIAWLLPWSQQEEHFVFRLGWPTIGAIWGSLKGCLEQSPNFVDGPRMCLCVSLLMAKEAPTGKGLKEWLDMWNHWCNRAKKAARERVNDEKVWQELFGWLLPDKEDGEET